MLNLLFQSWSVNTTELQIILLSIISLLVFLHPCVCITYCCCFARRYHSRITEQQTGLEFIDGLKTCMAGNYLCNYPVIYIMHDYLCDWITDTSSQ